MKFLFRVSISHLMLLAAKKAKIEVKKETKVNELDDDPIKSDSQVLL